MYIKCEASQCYTNAIDKGCVPKMRYYTFALGLGDGISMDKEEAFEYFKLDAENDDNICMHKVGLMHLNRDGTKTNKSELTSGMILYGNFLENNENDILVMKYY